MQSIFDLILNDSNLTRFWELGIEQLGEDF